MIVVENLKKSFGSNEVLKDISITIEHKEVVVVIGPSGSGKSTFLRCLNLLEAISGGHVRINGVDLADKKIDINKIRQKTGMVFQHFNLFPHKTVLENLMLAPTKVRRSQQSRQRIRRWNYSVRLAFLRRQMPIRIHYQGGRSKG